MSLRIAFFTDSFREANGVALTSREYVRFFQEKNFPVLSIHPGPEALRSQEGSVTTIELPSARLRLGLEHDLNFDLLFLRHRAMVEKELRAFKPDLVHVTGPGHCGILGTMLAHKLRVPLASSWHTNIHEYAGRRIEKSLRWLPAWLRQFIGRMTESFALYVTTLFYRVPRLIFAPNPELVDMLHRRTGRPAFLMQRGVDTRRFSPDHRTRTDDDFVLGYVGRLSPEKNVRMLADIERSLQRAGIEKYRFSIVGDGSEREWLSKNLKRVELPGVLRGEALSRAFSNMDLFLFPSATDTFGNVVLEAMASGMPAVVTSGGGPKFIVESGVTGVVTDGAAGFSEAVLQIVRNPALYQRMSKAARQHAVEQSWAAIFESVHERYIEFLSPLGAEAAVSNLAQKEIRL